ncbi:hypothetical protein BDQ17DRAFT_1477394 [Cyathus striatus]|nr:hypothetical protein BDQ17DRAFT_1477394 [Cyathus striatus]
MFNRVLLEIFSGSTLHASAVPNEIVHACLETYFGTVLVQSFVNGLYTFLMIRAIRSAVARSAVVIILGSARMLKIAGGAQIAAMLVADVLLVWRCYIVWLKNKWLLAFFSILLLGEVGRFPAVCLIFFSLLDIDVIKILVASGILYSIPLLITGKVVTLPNKNMPVSISGTYLTVSIRPSVR